MADQNAKTAIDSADGAVTNSKPAAETSAAPAATTASAAKAEAAPALAARAKAAAPAARKRASKRTKPAKATQRTAAANRKPAAKAVVQSRKPVRAGSRRKIEGVVQMNKKTQQTIDTGLFAADQLQNVFGDVNVRAKAAAERSAKVAEDLADLTRGNVEAFVASSKIAAKGVESLSQDAAEYSRKAFEEASATLKNFAEVKSATDFFKLQGDYTRAAFDNAIAESARLSETMLKLAGEVAEPITNRYTVAAERVKTLAA